MANQTCRGATGGRRVRSNAFIDDDAVLKWLADPAALKSARSYWSARFLGLDEKLIDSGALSNRMVASLSDGLRRIHRRSSGFRQLQPILDLPDGHAVFGGLVDDARCLLSLDEAAAAIIADADGTEMLQAVRAVFGTGDLPTQAQQQLLGARGMRELYDLIRRWRINSAIAGSIQCARSIVLAYWRQEGNLCLAPPSASLAHAPLVDTAPGTCRTPCVSFSGDARRDGFLLALKLPEGWTSEFEWPLTVASLLILGGLDQIAAPLLSEQDELWVLYKAAAREGQFLRLGLADPSAYELAKLFAASSVADDVPGPNATAGQNQRVIARQWFAVMAGLASLQLEVGMEADVPDLLQRSGVSPRQGGGAAKLLASGEERFLGLLQAHPGVLDGRHVFLDAREDARETLRVVHSGVELLESRRSMNSFLAVRDRGAVPQLPPMSDFMTYLRFHATDALFGSYLVRVGAMLPGLVKLGNFRRDSPFHQAMLGVRLPEEFAKRMQKIRDKTWRRVNARRNVPRAQMIETVWRHIGLIERLRGASEVPAWLPKTPPPDPLVLETADAAAEVVRLLHEHDALPAIESFLSATPFSRLIKLATHPGLLPGGDVITALAPLAKAHSFARLRNTYAEAMGNSELADRVPP